MWPPQVVVSMLSWALLVKVGMAACGGLATAVVPCTLCSLGHAKTRMGPGAPVQSGLCRNLNSPYSVLKMIRSILTRIEWMDIEWYRWSLHQMPAPDSWATLGWVKLAKCHRDRIGILPISLALLAFVHYWILLASKNRSSVMVLINGHTSWKICLLACSVCLLERLKVDCIHTPSDSRRKIPRAF